MAGERSDLVYLGFDISRPMLREAAARPSRARFMAGDASRAFPCGDRVCGLVFAVDVIHHIEGGRLATFFSEAVRVLMPGGRLVLVTDSEDTLRQRSLTKFFPEILAIELQRYPPLAAPLSPPPPTPAAPPPARRTGSPWRVRPAHCAAAARDRRAARSPCPPTRPAGPPAAAPPRGRPPRASDSRRCPPRSSA